MVWVPVARDVKATLALATTAPLISVSRPVIEPVVWVWAEAKTGNKNNETKRSRSLERHRSLRCIHSPEGKHLGLDDRSLENLCDV